MREASGCPIKGGFRVFPPLSFAEAPQGVAGKKSALQIADFRQHPRSTGCPKGQMARVSFFGSFFGQAKNEQYYQIFAESVEPFRVHHLRWWFS